jgi:hypothetical protein
MYREILSMQYLVGKRKKQVLCPVAINLMFKLATQTRMHTNVNKAAAETNAQDTEFSLHTFWLADPLRDILTTPYAISMFQLQGTHLAFWC